MKPAPQTEGCLLKPPRIHRPVEITSHSSNHAKGMGIRATASATHQWPSTLRMNQTLCCCQHGVQPRHRKSENPDNCGS